MKLDIFQKTKQDLTSMENLIGKKIRTCVFISGTGSNLKAIIKNSRDYNFPIKIELIISNNIEANGLQHAKKYNIQSKFYSSYNQNLFEKNCLRLKKTKPSISSHRFNFPLKPNKLLAAKTSSEL